MAAAANRFRALVERAERKFALARDIPPYDLFHSQKYYFSKVFKAYMLLWKYQQENRSDLVRAGLNRWEIGEIARRIGQLYFERYMRTSEARFLVEAYVFYEAIFSRRYFSGSKSSDVGVKMKELKFYARFLVVLLILNRMEMVDAVLDSFQSLIDYCKTNFEETHFKDWKLVAQEIIHFLKVNKLFTSVRPLRYNVQFDSHPTSHPFFAGFHSAKITNFQHAILSSYHHNEAKFADLNLDIYRMLQCLEWELLGSFCPKRPGVVLDQNHQVESTENGSIIDHSGASGLRDTSLALNLTDSNLPQNPKKTILYHPTVMHFLRVIATICDELPLDGVVLIYLSASGSCSLCPGDLIPYTRRPLFLIIDSDISHAFKVLHGAERGEAAALLLSPLRPVFKSCNVEMVHMGSQFTFFLTSPIQAFCHMDVCIEAEEILFTAFSQWEVILCTSSGLDLVWAQVLLDPFLRRLILRFIFCRAALLAYQSPDNEADLPVCLPHLPPSLSPRSEIASSVVFRLADHFQNITNLSQWK